MFKRIAVALDGSECAAQALAVGLQLAQSERAEIGVCSVVDPIIVAGTAPPSPAMDLVIRDLEVAARKTVEDAEKLARERGLRASGQARSGVPAFEILKYCEVFGADLLVMGTHGRKGFGHFLMGSVAEMLLRESPIPVLVVRAARAKSAREQKG